MSEDLKELLWFIAVVVILNLSAGCLFLAAGILRAKGPVENWANSFL